MKIIRLVSAVCLVFSACSFDYGNTGKDSSRPDIVMRNVEYVRARNGDPLVRFEAEYAERYEERKVMNLEQFSFEQFENHGVENNALGNAGEALVELDSGNIQLSGGVRIVVESEDIVIETSALEWRDREKRLVGEPDAEVEINRSDGTGFAGRGFSANARERTWVFASGVEGAFVERDEETPAREESEDSPQ